jgi:AraC-like DNA-binding protein/mannose-6-phosphate isomerase-like protein (cupin superfamily)
MEELFLMSNAVIYRYIDFMEEAFPFKMVFISSAKNLNRVQHAHEHFQVCYISRGLCKHSIGDRLSTLSRGDIIAIPPFEEHQLIAFSDADDDLELIQIDFMPFFINDNMRELSTLEGFADFLYIQPLMQKNNPLWPKLNISSTNIDKVEALIESMKTELRNKEEGFQLSIKADLLKFLVIIGREFKSYAVNHGKNDAINQYKNNFKDIILFIEENFSSDLKLEDIAQKANMSPSYFSHMFKLIKGSTLIDYINQLRINKAMDLLVNTNQSIIEVSSSVGFNNLGHFNRMFKRISGITPSLYRKSKRSSL